MTHDIKPGTHYCWRGATVVVKAVEDEVVTVQPVGTTILCVAAVAELTPLVKKQESLAPALQISEDVWERSTALANACRHVLTQPGAKVAAMQDLARRFSISTRQAYNIVHAYRTNPTAWALVPTKKGRKTGTRVLDKQRELLMAGVIENDYLKREKPSVAVAYEALLVACANAGVPAPAKNTFRARIEHVALDERIRRRQGRKRANETCHPASGHVTVDRPLQRVEIDHTLVDVQCRADTRARERLGRPWLTLAIDYYTRMVVGFHLSFERPSSTSVALCVAHAVLNKSEWMKRFGIPGEWPVHGFMEEIWVDNAMEFRALALRRGCDRNGIKLCYRPPGEPQVGGAIERLMGTTMGRVHTLPGTTQSNVQQRGDYDSEGRAVLTLPELATWLTLQIVTQYHTRTHTGLGQPPLAKWNDSAVAAKDLAAPLEVLADFLPAAERVLRRTGVEINRATYWSTDFAPWVGAGKKIVAHYHGLDALHIYVRLPNGQLTVATNTRPDTCDKTVGDRLRQMAADREREKDPALTSARHAGHAQAARLVQDAIAASTVANKFREQNAIPTPKAPGIALYLPSVDDLLPVVLMN